MPDQAEVAHDLAPKARIEQVKDGVLDAADVLIDWKPVGNLGGIVGSFIVVRVAVTIEIPGRVDEGVHGIGFAARETATFRARGVHKFGSGSERRSAFAGERDIVRKDYRQILVQDRHHSIVGREHYPAGGGPATAS